MFTPRSLFRMLAGRSRLALLTVGILVLAVAVPVFAAMSDFTSNNNGEPGATTVTAPRPANLAVGDVMIAAVQVNSDTVTIATPAGWNHIATRVGTWSGAGNSDIRLATYWKEAVADDVSATNFEWTLSASARAFAGIARYDDVAVTSGTPIVPTTGQAFNPTTTPDAAINSSNMVANSVTTAQPGSYVTAIYAMNAATAINTGPSGMTPLYNNGRAGTDPGRLAAYDVSQAAAGASNTKTATTAANVRYVSQTLALKPKPKKLAFTTPARSGAVNDCLGPITVEMQNTPGVPVQPGANPDVGLASDGAGTFHNAAGCGAGTAITQSTVQASQTSTTFFYKPTDRGDGLHTITATATGLTQATQDATVKLNQTISFDQPQTPQVYGDNFDRGTATSDSGLTVTVTPSGGCEAVSGTTVKVTSAATDCTLTASQAGNGDYAPAQNVVRTVVTDPRPITVTADSGQSKVYSNNAATDPTFTYQVTSGSLVGTDTFTGALTRAAGETVAGSPYTINQGTLSAGSNYTLSYVSAGFNITKKQLSVDANANSKTYGASDPNLTAALVGFVSGQNRNNAGVTGSESCSRTTGETVAGSPYTITCTPGTLEAPNYSFATGTTANFTINRKQININADPASKTYGETDPALTGQLSGFVNGEDATSAGVTGDKSCTRSIGEAVAGSPYTITCTAGTLAADNYSFATGTTANFTINKKQLTVDADPGTKVYGAADPTLTATLNGFEFGENRATANVTGAEDCDRSGTDQDVGTYTDVLSCTAGTLDAANYTFTAGGTNDFTITPKELSVDADPKSKIYGQSDPAFTATLTGFEFGENRTTGGVTGAEDCDRSGTDEDAGTYTDVISCTVGTLDADNYTFAVGDTADFTINKKQLDIDADPASKTYGQTDPAFTGTLNGFVNGEDATSAGVTGDEACSRTGSQEDVGTYNDVITCSQGTLDADNYSFAGGTAADFTVNKKQLDINADPNSKTYGQSDPAFTGQLSGFEFGEDATSANVTGTANCTRTGAQQDVDTYTDVITCAQGTLDAANYSFATGTAADFTINPKQLDVDANPASKTYGQSDPTFTATLTGFAFSEDRISAGVTGAEDCDRTGTDEDVGTYNDVLSCTAGTLAADNYTFAAGDTADFTINAKTVSASFTVDNKVYDRSTDATITASDLDETDLEGTDDVTLDDTNAEADFADRNVGTGKSVTANGFDLDGADAGNYTLSLDPETANITAKPVDGSFTAADKQYDGTTAAVASNRQVDATDVISPDVVTLTGGTANFDTAAVANNKTVTLTGATLGGADAGNYQIGTIATDQANITPKELTGQFSADNKVYDGDNTATGTPSLVGVVGTEDVHLAGTPTFDNEDVGNNKTVTLGSASLTGTDMGNYTLAAGAITDIANITARPVDGSFTAADKVYDGSTAATVTNRSFETADLVAPGDVTALTGGSADFSSANVGNNKTVTLTGASLTGPEASNYTVGTIATDTANITTKSITASFTAANKAYNGSAGATVTARSLNGAVSDDDVSLSGGTASFANPDVGNNKTVTLSGASLVGADQINYTLGSVGTDQANITPKALTGSFTAANKVFDGTTAATILTRSLSGVVGSDAVALSGGTATFADPNPGVGKVVTGTGFTLAGADSGNYSLGSVATTTANIQRAPAGTDQPPTEEELEQSASDALGGDVKALDLGLDLASVFAPEGQTNRIKATNQSLFAIGCTADCEVGAKKTVVLTVPDGAASAAATKKIRLKPQNMSLAAGEMGVVKLKLTRKQKKAIRKADKAKLVVKLAVTSGGQTETGKKTYRLKATKG